MACRPSSIVFNTADGRKPTELDFAPCEWRRDECRGEMFKDDTGKCRCCTVCGEGAEEVGPCTASTDRSCDCRPGFHTLDQDSQQCRECRWGRLATSREARCVFSALGFVVAVGGPTILLLVVCGLLGWAVRLTLREQSLALQIAEKKLGVKLLK